MRKKLKFVNGCDILCDIYISLYILSFLWRSLTSIEMIRRLADEGNTQFITTTFRPEIVKVANKIYGVTHKNRVSRVNVISENDALEFINHD